MEFAELRASCGTELGGFCRDAGSCSEALGYGDPAHHVFLCSFSLKSNKVPVVQHPHHVHPLTPLITYSNEHFTPGNPPPHLPADVDPKTGKLGNSEGLCQEPGPDMMEGVGSVGLGVGLLKFSPRS